MCVSSASRVQHCVSRRIRFGSARVSGGTPPRQGVHCLAVRLMATSSYPPSLFARRIQPGGGILRGSRAMVRARAGSTQSRAPALPPRGRRRARPAHPGRGRRDRAPAPALARAGARARRRRRPSYVRAARARRGRGRPGDHDRDHRDHRGGRRRRRLVGNDRRHERRGERLPRRGGGAGDLRQRPGGRERRRARGPLYAFPVFGLLALGIAAVALGIARRALDELVALAGAKTPTGSRRLLAERPAIQAEVARAEATLGAARAFLAETVGGAWERAQTAGAIEIRERARLRLAATHATLASACAVELVYGAGGGTAVYAASPLQRCFRDIHVATQHAMVAPATLELAGRILLGLEADTAML